MTRDFLADFAEMSAFGATARNGLDRLAGTESHRDVRAWLTELLTEQGFEAQSDAAGNLFWLRRIAGDAPFVLFGSHLDSQPKGGRYDGSYGVLAAAHAAITAAGRLRAAGRTPRYNIAVVDWFNEEGARFKPSMMGSGVFTGKLDLDAVLATTDRLGTSVRDALDAMGARGDFVLGPVAGYAEIHIEQGRSLEEQGITIGVVEATWSAHKFEILVRGDQSHTGSTRMADRKDALLGAAHLVVGVRGICAAFPEEALHTSVGELNVFPNSPVTVAGEVSLLVDLRAPSDATLEQAGVLLRAAIAAAEAASGTEIEIVKVNTWNSGPFLERGIALVERAAEESGRTSTRVLTLAGHDATNVKDIAPTALVFVPSVAGITHNEAEYTRDEDALAGVEVFTRVVEQLALGALDGEPAR
ncbi:M20 family metallo-hydrolase [Microbacterium sp. 18062]|uniref:M20 family metallo-hydrolase n=1 Tax=Microbacterium sp. 18062 TaxID=2681410 RepID=UPI001F2E175E|nr:M20 family metallo-hydrolase [Microbacterium sp. 18062]